MMPKKYLLSFLIFYGVLSIFVVLTNTVVDPFSVIGSPRYEGFNQFKVDINSRVRLSKTYQPLRANFHTLIVGNSRVEMGINPKHTCLSLNERKSYNLGIPGADVGYQVASALNLAYQKPIDTILISIDFTDFLVLPRHQPSIENTGIPNLNNTSYRVDGSVNDSYRLRYLKDHYQSLYSLDAFLSSLKTIVLQNPYAPSRDDAGFNSAMDFVEMTSTEGVNHLFRQKEKELESKYMNGWSLYYSNGGLSQDFSYLEEFISRTTERGIRVVVFTNPLHQNFWEVMKRAGLMKQNAVFLDEIKKIIYRSGNQYVDFWDFSGDSVFIHEDLSKVRRKGVGLKWFWEPAHYKKELGDLMIESIFSKECGTKEIFGQKIISAPI
ncbi:MAG: hypothetical protein JKY85_08350 [Porticoccus sp.]|nr:hypothetical protein [Porticoccus sp.]